MKTRMNVNECKLMLKAIDTENDPILDSFLSAQPKRKHPIPKPSNRTYAGSIIFDKNGMRETARIDILLAMHAIFSEKVTVETIAKSSMELFLTELSPTRLAKHVRDCLKKPDHFFTGNIDILENNYVRFSQKFISLVTHDTLKDIKRMTKEFFS